MLMSKELRELEPINDRVKQPKIVDALVAMAHKLGPGARLPRLRQLAKALHVSVKSLQSALEKVEDRGLLDRFPGKGIYVAKTISQKTIGLVMGLETFGENREGVFYGILLGHCLQLAIMQQERFSFYIDLPRPDHDKSVVHKDLARALANRQLDGLLVVAYLSEDRRKQEWFNEQGIPVVSYSNGENSPSVAIDRMQMVKTAMQQIAQQGCRKVGLIYTMVEEKEFFLGQASLLGLETRENWIRHSVASPFGWSDSPLRPELVAEQLFSQREFLGGPIPGLISTDDNLTRGLCKYFDSRDIEIGKQVIVASHANKNSPVLAEWSNRLILCEFDAQEIAEKMFEMLEILIHGNVPPSDTILVPPRLVLPKSLGA